MSEKGEFKNDEKSHPTQQALNYDDEPVVTFKTWIVVAVCCFPLCEHRDSLAKNHQILSTGYGLSFLSVPLMAAIGCSLATEFGDPLSSNWYIAAWTLGISVSFMIWYLIFISTHPTDVANRQLGVPIPMFLGVDGSSSWARPSALHPT
jgi:hypothetical protein